MIINKPYSLNALASILASPVWESKVVDWSKIHFQFTDCDVSVKGEMIGTFDVQKQTYEDPPYNDLVDVHIEILSVVVSGENRDIIYTWEEKDKLVQTIKKLLI